MNKKPRCQTVRGAASRARLRAITHGALLLAVAAGARAADFLAPADWLAAVTYLEAEDKIVFDTTGELPPQAKALASGDPNLIRFELTALRVNPDIYTLAPRDGVVNTIRIEGKKDRGAHRLEVTVETTQPFQYELERRQVEGGLSQVIFRLTNVTVKRSFPDIREKAPIYARPAADSQIVAFMPYHTKVTVLDYAKGMYLVRTADDVLGWLQEKYIKIEGENPFKPSGPTPPAANLREKIIATAKGYLGVPYVWGGTSAEGFDCSGLVQTVFAENGVQLPRGAGDQYRQGKNVAVGALRPGDLIFFHTYTKGPSHVGIWLGDGKFLHAESSPRGVTITPLAELYWHERVLGGRTWLAAEE
jgi:hypothetical protein